jgi:hypothetical protein
VLKVNLISIASYKLRQKLEVNFVSRSDTMDTGTPCSCTIPNISSFMIIPTYPQLLSKAYLQNIFQKLFPCAPHALTFLISLKHLDNNYQLTIYISKYHLLLCKLTTVSLI